MCSLSQRATVAKQVDVCTRHSTYTIYSHVHSRTHATQRTQAPARRTHATPRLSIHIVWLCLYRRGPKRGRLQRVPVVRRTASVFARSLCCALCVYVRVLALVYNAAMWPIYAEIFRSSRASARRAAALFAVSKLTGLTCVRVGRAAQRCACVAHIASAFYGCSPAHANIM